MHPIFPFIIDVSRVYFLITLIRFLVSNTVNNVCFNSTVSHFHKSGFVWSELRKNENIWFTITSHSLFQVVMCAPHPIPPHPTPPHSISDKHRPRYRLTFSSITISGGCLMRSVAAKQNHKKSHQTRADEIPVCLLSSLCLTARQHLLTHWYDACCAVSLTPLGVSVSSHFSSHRAERVKRGRLAELHSHE